MAAGGRIGEWGTGAAAAVAAVAVWRSARASGVGLHADCSMLETMCLTMTTYHDLFGQFLPGFALPQAIETPSIEPCKDGWIGICTYTAQQWRLSMSRDGGRTFGTIHEETNATNPATLETDAAGNIYLIRPDFGDGNAYLYRFLAENDYANPTVHAIPGGTSGKVCAAIDLPRERLYWLGNSGGLRCDDGTSVGFERASSSPGRGSQPSP